ncbi:MAG: hypothetical protein IPO07_20465 [Haliscomenobacter sp.]|nr:hypothetical protein [Haliscomenobacter sp.]
MEKLNQLHTLNLNYNQISNILGWKNSANSNPSTQQSNQRLQLVGKTQQTPIP